MSLFDGSMQHLDRVRLVARMMGYDPNSDDYPIETINNLLNNTEYYAHGIEPNREKFLKLAEKRLREEINRLMRNK